MMSKMLGILPLLLLASAPAFGLIPLDGLLKGQVEGDQQFDPLSSVFQSNPETNEGSKQLHKSYIIHTLDSLSLKQSCDYIGKANYASPTDEVRAQRSVVATLQYLGLDATVKSIGHLSRQIQMERENFVKLVDNLVSGSCSPNLSVYGPKLLKANFLNSFDSYTDQTILPTFPVGRMASSQLLVKSQSLEVRERELHHGLMLFRSLCSWGGDTDNFRLLAPLLKNPLIMSWVFRHLEGKRISWSKETNQATIIEDAAASVQVLCPDMICRRVELSEFKKNFPKIVGSSGTGLDLKRMWCQHLRDQTINTSDTQHPMIREWGKKLNPEDENLMAGQMLSLFTGLSDMVVMAKTFNELTTDLRSPIDERWSSWANTNLKNFSRDTLYEEAMEIKVRPLREELELSQRNFRVDFAVTMGELDRVFKNSDKVSQTIPLKLSQNWLRWLRRQWFEVNSKASPELREEFITQTAKFIKIQIDAKKKYFPTPLFGDGLEELIALELISQVERYEGGIFTGLDEKMLTIPVRFHYGLFALSYMRYKAQIKARSHTLDL